MRLRLAAAAVRRDTGSSWVPRLDGQRPDPFYASPLPDGCPVAAAAASRGPLFTLIVFGTVPRPNQGSEEAHPTAIVASCCREQ